MMGRALAFANDRGWGRWTGSRRTIPKTLIVITDGDSKGAVFYRTYPLLYHKFENMVIFRSGNLY